MHTFMGKVTPIFDYSRTFPKRKYKNKPQIFQGQRFASVKELLRFKELNLLLSSGEIKDLKVQPKFPILVLGVKVCTYIGDFMYTEKKSSNKWVVEDVKGVETSVFKIKKKLFSLLYKDTHELRIIK